MIKNLLLVFLLLWSIQAVRAQADTIPPVIVCKPGLFHFPIVSPMCQGPFWANDAIDSLSDDLDPAPQLGIRKACTGSGFPNSIQVPVYEWGFVNLEIWAMDAAGNTSSCPFTLLAFDGLGACDPIWQVSTQTHDSLALPGVEVRIQGWHCIQDSVEYAVTTSAANLPAGLPAWWYQYGYVIPTEGYGMQMVPQKNTNPLNGVSTQDLTLIQLHLLGIQPFTKPWQYIAADANQDGKVTAYDLIVLRKLLLGYESTLPNGKSWRFWRGDYQFPANGNPLQPAFPEIYVDEMVRPIPNWFFFTGVKIGDLSGDADPGL
ncbi:MAG: hypothetical protein IPL65_12270 [Lewinellaceae bacterium]|nr:hypothetical protein [Lewinellaceae bacterium]